MSTRFYPIPVSSVDKTTDDCVLITFDIPSDLIAQFSFTQGQYLTLKADINGEDVCRSYSLCTAPSEGKWQVAVKQVPQGRFSTFANETLQAGDVLEVMPPAGHFNIAVDPSHAKNYVAFAAGSGITPILSIIKTHLDAEPESSFQLFYTNQAVNTIILKEEVEALKNTYLNRFELYHFLTREQRSAPLFNGRIDEEKLDMLCKHFIDVDEVDDVFLCGPNAMIFLVKDYFAAKGMDASKIHFELFNTDDLGAKAKMPTEEEIDMSKMSAVSIIEGGKTIDFTIPQRSNNLLDAALQNSADLPFACKGGVCCTCRAKLVEGEVEMLVNFALEPEEVEAGFILTCQALPTTERVVVDFDTISS